MLIGSVSRISYLNFLAHLGPIAIVGLLMDWALVHWVYLRRATNDTEPQATPLGDIQRHSPSAKPVIVLTIVLIGFVAGVPAAIMAALGAAALLITRTMEPRLVYDEVDWGLLVLFTGLFIIVGGAERSGLTETLLRPFNNWNLHRICIYVFTGLFLIVGGEERSGLTARKQCARCGTAQIVGSRFPRYTYRLANTSDGEHAGRQPDYHRLGSEHHRRRACQP